MYTIKIVKTNCVGNVVNETFIMNVKELSPDLNFQLKVYEELMTTELNLQGEGDFKVNVIAEQIPFRELSNAIDGIKKINETFVSSLNARIRHKNTSIKIYNKVNMSKFEPLKEVNLDDIKRKVLFNREN